MTDTHGRPLRAFFRAAQARIPAAICADRRGLYLAEHHITLLGTNCFQWPKGVPYTFAKSRETLEYTWHAVAKQQADKKMLWTVGYRGLNDYPFWNDGKHSHPASLPGMLLPPHLTTSRT